MKTNRFIHFEQYSTFAVTKMSANEANTTYTLGAGVDVYEGEPDIAYQCICWIADTLQQWTHGQLYSFVDFDINGKQDVLYSGENIKTVDGESILSSGDIPMSKTIDTKIKQKVFVGTLEEYNTAYAAGNVAVGAVVIILDENESTGGGEEGGENASSITAMLGKAILGQMKLGQK